MQSREMAFEQLHCGDSPPPSGSPPAYPCQACGPPSSSGGDSDPSQDIWHPYWVRCKFHGWQQCTASTAEIAMLQWPANNRSDTQRRCKRSRYSLRDDFQIGQIEALLASLSAEQMSVAASVLMEQYIRRSAILTTPHADDIAGFKATCLVTKSMAARQGDDPSCGQTSRNDQVAASSSSYCCDQGEFVNCQLLFIRATADADVDVS